MSLESHQCNTFSITSQKMRLDTSNKAMISFPSHKCLGVRFRVLCSIARFNRKLRSCHFSSNAVHQDLLTDKSSGSRCFLLYHFLLYVKLYWHKAQRAETKSDLCQRVVAVKDVCLRIASIYVYLLN